jgi:hypothetical protein
MPAVLCITVDHYGVEQALMPAVVCVTVDHYGVEQAFMPAVVCQKPAGFSP